MKRTVTIKDIAREAGVDPSTVSRVLSGKRIAAADTMNAIFSAVDKLQYRPSIIAQELRSGKSRTIGVLVENIESPFHSHLLRAIEMSLQGSGYYPIFASRDWARTDNIDAMDALLRRGMAALIFVGEKVANRSSKYLLEYASQIPLVVVSGATFKGLERHCMSADNFGGAYAATKHLIDLGHTRIAHIMGWFPGEDSTQRRDGYLQALKDAGLPVDPDLMIQGHYDEESGYEAAVSLLDRNIEFSALFTANDMMAYGAILALHQRGLSVPDHVSIVGFDDERYSAYCLPPLTTVRHPIPELGRVVVEAVLDLIAGEEIVPTKVPTELIIRHSTAPFHK